MFKKADQIFDEIADDPVRRRKQITQLTKVRPWVFGSALGLMVVLCTLIIFMIALHQPAQPVTAITLLTVIMIWNSYFRLESDLKLLRFIDRLKNERVRGT